MTVPALHIKSWRTVFEKGILSLTLVSYLFLMAAPFVPLIHYNLHRDYIAKYLCVNRDKPQMHCDGKCFLYKQWQKQVKQEQDRDEKSKKELYGSFAHLLIGAMDAAGCMSVRNRYAAPYAAHLLYAYRCPDIPPPRSSVSFR